MELSTIDLKQCCPVTKQTRDYEERVVSGFVDWDFKKIIISGKNCDGGQTPCSLSRVLDLRWLEELFPFVSSI